MNELGSMTYNPIEVDGFILKQVTSLEKHIHKEVQRRIKFPVYKLISRRYAWFIGGYLTFEKDKSIYEYAVSTDIMNCFNENQYEYRNFHLEVKNRDLISWYPYEPDTPQA